MLIFLSIFGLLFISLVYYLVLYLTVDKTTTVKETNLYEMVIGNDGNEQTLKRQYPADMEFPGFVVRDRMEVPSELEANYDFFELFGVRVVSTGKLSTTTIKDPPGVNTLAEVLQLEVYIDDEQGYLTTNKPFNIALRVYPEPYPEEDIAPIYLMNIVQQIESKRLHDELGIDSNAAKLTNEQVETLNEKFKSLSEKYIVEGITQEKIEEMFKEDTIWVIAPYLKDDLITYTLGSEEALYHNYIVLLDEYYGGNDSALVEKILSRDVSETRDPVMISDLFVNFY